MDPYSQKRQRLEYGHHFATNGGHAPQFVGTINGFVAPGPAYDQQHLPYSSGPADMAAVTAAADYGTTYYASAGEEAMGLTLPSSMPMAYSQVAFDSAAMNGLHCIQNGMRHAPSLQDHIQHSQHRSSEEAYPDATYFPGTPATWSASLHGLPTSDSYQETENEYVPGGCLHGPSLLPRHHRTPVNPSLVENLLLMLVCLGTSAPCRPRNKTRPSSRRNDAKTSKRF